MNFNILFNIVANLSFTIDFYNSDESYQDFFIFNGDNTSANLFRKNDTIILYLKLINDFEIYNLDNITDSFSFSWSKFTINNEQMKCVKNSTEIKNLKFTNFTFISPIIDIYSDFIVEPLLETLGKFNGFNYGYLVLITVFVGIILKSKIISLELYIKIFDIFRGYCKTENDYATVNKFEIETLECASKS